MSDFPNSRRILYGAALAVFGALAGAGVAWIAIATFANSLPKTQGDSFVAGSIPKLVAGGTFGFMVGFVAALFLLRTTSASALAAWEEKYIGRRGALSIYSGVPILFMALLVPELEPLARTFGNVVAPCIFLFIALVFGAVCLKLHDRIPPSFIVPIGLVSWLLTFTLASWYSWFGPGALGHHHL